jgi:hypothetical protein
MTYSTEPPWEGETTSDARIMKNTRKSSREKIVRRIIWSSCAFFFVTAVPLFAQSASRPHEGKSPYLMYMIYLSGALVLLFIWEFVDWIVRKKTQVSLVESTETISVVDEAQDDDPFRALLKEESAGYNVISQAKPPAEPEQAEEPELEPETVETYQETPIVQKVEREEKKEKKRLIHVDIQPPPAAPETVAAGSPVLEEKRKVKLAEPVAIDEEGWRDLMQKASQENEQLTEAKKADVQTAAVLSEEMPAVSKKTKELQQAAVPEPPEEEDPWKALLKKSKQEEESNKEVEKPWSSLIKGEAGKDAESRPLEAAPIIELGDGRKAADTSSAEIRPIFSGGGKDAEHGADSDAAEAEMKEGQGRVPDVKAIDLKVEKKKEDIDREKKSSSKESIPTFIKKASRVITIPSPFDKGEDKEEQRKSPGVLSSPKDERKFISLDGSSRKAGDEEKSED